MPLESQRLLVSAQASFEREPKQKKRVVPVIRVKDIQGPITSELVETLHLIDLRIRALNLFFPIRAEGGNLEKRSERQGSIALRGDILQPVFLPNEKLNPLYYLRSLEGMRITILDPTKNRTQATPLGIVGEEPQAPARLIDFFTEPKDQFRKYRIVNGKPHRLVSPNGATSTNLVILKITKNFEESDNVAFQIIKTIDPVLNLAQGARNVLNYFFEFDEESSIQNSINLTYVNPGETSGNNPREFALSSPDTITRGKSFLRKQIENVFFEPTRTRLIQQLNEIVENELKFLTQGVQEVSLLPIVISDFPNGTVAAEKFVLDFASVGMPISLLDLGIHFGRYSGTIPKDSISKDASKKQQEHERGQAFDLTLVPYYIRTGIVLKKHTPFILTSQFPARNHSNLAFRTFPNIRLKSDLTTSVYEAPQIKIIPDSTASMSQLIADMFSRWARIETGTEEILSINDLTDDDQRWYHVFATTFGGGSLRGGSGATGSF